MARFARWILWPVEAIVGAVLVLILVALFMDDEGEYPRRV